MAREELSYCAAQVRRHDHDRFLTCLFAPAGMREHLFALYAFNLEVARTAESVSEPMLGQIRLQWWRECLAEIFAGRPRRHEVVEPLAAAIEAGGLPPPLFERLIDAREADLEPEPPADLAGLEAYAEATAGTLLSLALGTLMKRDGEDEECQAVARHLGIAWALTGLLRAVPFHALQKRLYLPRDLTAAEGLDLGDLFEMKTSPALSRVAAVVAHAAARHLERARRLSGAVPRQARSPLLLSVLARRYLVRLAQAGHDPFEPLVQTQLTTAAWRLTLASLLGRY